MKKFLACTLALTMTAAMLASCGDSNDSTADSSKAESTTAATTTAETSAPAEETSAADSTADSKSDESGEEAQPKDISELPSSLANYETASLKFTTDMNVDDFAAPMASNDYTDDESKVKLSIEEVSGVPMLKVETLDKDDAGNYKVSKINLLMNKLFKGQEADLPKIFTIKVDMVSRAIGPATNDDGEEVMCPSFFGGKICTQPRTDAGTDKASNSWNELTEFGESEWTSEWASYEFTIRPGIKPASQYVDTTEDQYLTFMKWGIPNNACFYIADIQFEDADGNVIECNYGK